MEEIKELTEEQALAIPAFRKEWLDVGCNTDPSDRPAAEDAARRIYAAYGRTMPKAIWMDGPEAACRHLAAKMGGNPSEYLNQCLYGQLESSWFARFIYAQSVLGLAYTPEDTAKLAAFADLARSTGIWWPFENAVVFSERPEIVSLETDRERPRIHSTTGPALRYRDGHEVYALRGTIVDKRLVMQPETITAEEVLATQNIELRRILIAQMGEDKFIEQGSFSEAGRDADGTLFVKGEMALLRVVNSSPEPDGTFKVVYLEVFPTLEEAKRNCLPPLPGFKNFQDYAGPYTPHVARAWTFGVHPDEFDLAVET